MDSDHALLDSVDSLIYECTLLNKADTSFVIQPPSPVAFLHVLCRRPYLLASYFAAGTC
jgi:hypothetical protein